MARHGDTFAGPRTPNIAKCLPRQVKQMCHTNHLMMENASGLAYKLAARSSPRRSGAGRSPVRRRRRRPVGPASFPRTRAAPASRSCAGTPADSREVRARAAAWRRRPYGRNRRLTWPFSAPALPGTCVWFRLPVHQPCWQRSSTAYPVASHIRAKSAASAPRGGRPPSPCGSHPSRGAPRRYCGTTQSMPPLCRRSARRRAA